jgi:transposase
MDIPKERMPMGHIPEGDRMQSRIMCLDDMVAKDSMARIIDKFIDLVDLPALGFLNTTPKELGRNSYSPYTLAKLSMFAYEQGLRSSRERGAGRFSNFAWKALLMSINLNQPIPPKFFNPLVEIFIFL